MLCNTSTIHADGIYIFFTLILYDFNVEIIDLNKKLKSNENWNPNFGPHIKYMYFILKIISFLRIFQNLFLFLSCTTSRTMCPIMSAWGIVEDLDLLDDQQEHVSGGYGRLVEWWFSKKKKIDNLENVTLICSSMHPSITPLICIHSWTIDVVGDCFRQSLKPSSSLTITYKQKIKI